MIKNVLFYLMMLLVIPITTEAKKESFGYGLYWELTKQGELIISGNGAIPNYNFPYEFKRSGTAPWNQKKVWKKATIVIIQEGITEIGDNAFNGWAYHYKHRTTNITEIRVPSSVTRIGEKAFAYSAISSFQFPKNIEIIPSGLFYECYYLSQVTIPEGVKEIATEAFYNCDNLQSIALPKSLKKIGSQAFYETGLQDLYLPDNVEEIGKSAFYDCDRLLNIQFSSKLKSIGDYAFKGCEKITTIKLPSKLETIGERAFDCCNNLQHIFMGNGVKNIGEKAFYRCEKLNDIFIPQNTNVGKNLVGYADARLYSDSYRFDGTIYSISSSITEENCHDYGIETSALKKYKNGENGIINSDGKMILEAKSGRKAERKTDEYDNSVYYEITEGDGHGILDDNGKWIVPIVSGRKITRHQISRNKYVYYKITDKTGEGIIDSSGKTIIPTSRGYSSIEYNSNKGTFAVTKPGYTGVCNAQGQEISMTRLPPTANDIMSRGGYANAVEIMNMSTKYYKVKKGGKYGLTDAEGRVVIPVEMDVLEAAGTGFLRFKSGGFYGIMNFQGRTIIDTTRGYTSIGDYLASRRRFTYEMYGFKGECDNTGKELSRIKVATPQQSTATTNTTSNNSSNNTTGSGKTQTIVVEHHRDPVPVQQWQACWACGGMGTMGCNFCGGSGFIRDHRCSRCNGQGIIPCNICYGNKGQYITVYQ